MGFGSFELRYLGDKQKREVDFRWPPRRPPQDVPDGRRQLGVRDRKPWFLVEVKLSDNHLASSLGHFQVQTRAAHAFQAVMDLGFEAADCFRIHDPVVVPARTFLSQLL